MRRIWQSWKPASQNLKIYPGTVVTMGNKQIFQLSSKLCSSLVYDRCHVGYKAIFRVFRIKWTNKQYFVRRTRCAGHCWRSKDELISDVLLWTPAYGQAKSGWPARTYIQQLCEDTGCNPEDLPKAMNDREKWRERVRDIRAGGTTSWWWWWWLLFACGNSYFLLNDEANKISTITQEIYATRTMKGFYFMNTE